MKTVRVHVCTEHLIGTLKNLNTYNHHHQIIKYQILSNRETMRKDTFRER